MKEIITALMIWIGANSSLDTLVDIPQVIFLPQEQMESLYYSTGNQKSGTLHGFYNTKQDVVILPDTWDRRKGWDLSVLLHEVIHYVQDMNGITFQCLAEMEKDSWPLQQKYLKEVHNIDWNYDELWHLVISTCNPG
jgi:hypothetical protein|tara:strand:- start:804 stop:1214 length:411 start_codon:yes stop_codon:yes gene_type:complete